MKPRKKILLKRVEYLKPLKGGARASGGCWCTCHCMEAGIMGFQAGMMATVSSGYGSNPVCSTILSSIWNVWYYINNREGLVVLYLFQREGYALSLWILLHDDWLFFLIYNFKGLKIFIL